MFSLRIDEVKSGMTLAQPVFNMNGTKLLERDADLSEKMIERIKNAGARRLWVTDDSYTFLKEFGPGKICNEAVKELEKAKDRIVEGKNFDVQLIGEVSYELVEQIIFNEQPFAELVRMKSTEINVFEHMVDVSLLSIMTAKSMGMDKLDMRFLGFAALVHDVGKLLIPREILTKPSSLSDSEMRVVKKHPQIGSDILSNIEGINKFAPTVALQHHERLDGSGYPAGIGGRQIHLYSRIVAIADIYTALIREKVYRPKLPIYEAGEILWSQAGTGLDRNLTSNFLRNVVALPLRTTVKLNTGAVGKVVYQNGDFPTRPIVSVEGEMIDLSETPTVFVSEIVAYEHD